MEVLFFGKMADVAGRKAWSMSVSDGVSLHALRDRIFGDALAAGQIAARDIRMSVNKTVVFSDQSIGEDDEVAFFSVFSGG